MAVRRSQERRGYQRLTSIFRIGDLRSFLAGEWRLDRDIDDDRLGQNGVLHGLARFSQSGDGLAYREVGRLTFGDYADDVSRDYRYDFPEKAVARISFADGRPFHELDLRRGKAAVRHLCGDDIYNGVITADSPDRWTATWTVNGPRKAIRIASVFRREGSFDAAGGVDFDERQ
ncbi:MAG: DUF6314 family protein [Rhodospirillales bacterium]